MIVLAGAVSAAGTPTIVLPRPVFPASVTGKGSGTIHFTILSSTTVDPARSLTAPRPGGVRVEGPDGNTQHLVVGPGYTVDWKLLWRSAAQVANAANFVFVNDTVVTGYGYTAEPDYLYALDRATGKVKGRVLLPSAPIRIVRRGTTLTVDTYDHRVVVRVTGG
jgi:hypothetical protein